MKLTRQDRIAIRDQVAPVFNEAIKANATILNKRWRHHEVAVNGQACPALLYKTTCLRFIRDAIAEMHPTDAVLVIKIDSTNFEWKSGFFVMTTEEFFQGGAHNIPNTHTYKEAGSYPLGVMASWTLEYFV